MISATERIWDSIFKSLGGVVVVDVTFDVTLGLQPRDLYEMLLDTQQLDQVNLFHCESLPDSMRINTSKAI